mmetsp:Transcript_21774/g.69538  ORF Transcript_21774/g.69538 Transcript_21774/m.69538 type:complete len:254 (+) Transcript_21774:862-1623(+)
MSGSAASTRSTSEASSTTRIAMSGCSALVSGSVCDKNRPHSRAGRPWRVGPRLPAADNDRTATRLSCVRRNRPPLSSASSDMKRTTCCGGTRSSQNSPTSASPRRRSTEDHADPGGALPAASMDPPSRTTSASRSTAEATVASSDATLRSPARYKSGLHESRPAAAPVSAHEAVGPGVAARTGLSGQSRLAGESATLAGRTSRGGGGGAAAPIASTVTSDGHSRTRVCATLVQGHHTDTCAPLSSVEVCKPLR